MDESIPAALADNPQSAPAALETIEIIIGDAPRYSVIWLHGLGADGHDFVPVPPELGLAETPGTRFVFPHAPVIPVTLNGGMPMRAWYDIRSIGGTRDLDEAGVARASRMITALIDTERERGIDSANILLAGFSQGGAMALHVALRHPERLAGVISLSSYLICAAQLPSQRSAANADIPIFLAHGTSDPVVPFQAGLASRQALEDTGYTVTWREYPMPHSVCMEEIVEIGQWMRDLMA